MRVCFKNQDYPKITLFSTFKTNSIVVAKPDVMKSKFIQNAKYEKKIGGGLNFFD